MKKITFIFAILCSVSGLFAESQHGVVYVKPGATGTGASWNDALGNIQEAITAAKADPAARKDVWVATGEFEITSAISLLDSINVYGSFAGTESAVSERAKVAGGKAWEFANPTTLKGNNSRLIQVAAALDIPTTFDGFILTDGNGKGTVTDGSGGAALIRPNLIMQNCIVQNSTSAAAGAGVMMNTGGTLRNCLIRNNVHTTGSNGGGGVFCNTSSNGFTGYIENCDITGNSSTIRGAGIGIQGNTNTYISNCRIYNNVSVDGTTLKPGAGIFVNSAANQIINNLIYNNSGANAVYYNGGNLYNNIIVKNIGGLYGAGNTIKMINNVVWACYTDATLATATSITGAANSNSTVHNNATYNPLPTDKSWNLADNVLLSSNISNGDVTDPAAGTLGSGPKFTKVSSFIGASTAAEHLLNLDSVNWSLNGASPLVNIGKTVEAVTSDFAGLPRPQGYPQAEAKYDIGAYELPYYIVVAGEGETGNGYIYSALGEILAKDYSYGYAKGSKLELFFEPKSGYEMERAFYTVSNDGGLTFTGNEVDFKNDIDKDGFWSVAVHNSFKVNIVWRSLTSVKSLSDAGINCFGKQGGIQINGIPSAQEISIYNASGMKVKTITTNNSDAFVSLTQGIYLVKMNEGVQKVFVK